MTQIKESELTKLYYSIGEVAKMFDVNTSLIRFWEKEFPSVKLKKNKKGNRVFTPKDILKIDKIYILVKEKGYTLDGAKNALKDKQTDYSTEESQVEDYSAVILKLESIKERLLELKY
ncbi:MAG TPA: MerR family transcriptional regulator [Crocinitomicaceae bacterium]|nr:MerR family transcriptional regulator [Crocinitomicaceae bacterium]